MIYLIYSITPILLAFYSIFSKKTPKNTFYALLLLFTIVAFIRGEVGTDTTAYESIISNIEKTPNIEIGFKTYTDLVNLLDLSPLISVRLISIIFFFLVFIYIRKSNRIEFFIFTSFIIPVFSVQYSMNMLRGGISLMLLALAIQSINSKKMHASYLIISITNHSSALIGYLIFLTNKLTISIKKILIFLALLPILSFISLLNREYLSSKLDLYSEIESPDGFSGISKIILIALFIHASTLIKNIKPQNKFIFITSMSSFMLTFLLISRYSYAGLRLLDLQAFILPFIFIKISNGFDIHKNLKFYIIFISSIGSIFTLRNFFDENSSFIPYTTFF